MYRDNIYLGYIIPNIILSGSLKIYLYSYKETNLVLQLINLVAAQPEEIDKQWL